MTEPLLWMIVLAPAALAAVGLNPASRTASRARPLTRVAFAAAAFAFVVAIGAAVVVLMKGPLHTVTLGIAGVGFAIYVDRLTITLFLLVSFVGAVVVRYASQYLQGDPNHRKFMQWLCLALSAVILVILSGNLFQFLLALIATSICLNRLLLFYPGRPAAVLAARKKFVASRLGDACLIGALLLLHQTVGSLDYAAVFSHFESARSGAGIPGNVHPIAALLVVAALLKSAQFPLHGWLTEVMETPTPVSALLHAGIINAGGFLVLRFSPVIALSTPALDTLALVGGFTALFGSIVMLTQTSVKVALAYSTIAQMGFMMLECGLGAFSAALLHILAHSLYKAHAFLSSGSVIDLARASWSPSPGGNPHPARTAVAITAVLSIAAAVAMAFGAGVTQQPGVFALGAIVAMGLAHLVTQSIDERPNLWVLGRTIGLTMLVATAYFALQWAAERLFAGSLAPMQSLRGPLDLAIVTAVVAGFGLVTVLQNLMLCHTEKPRWQALYVHLANGLYVNAFANRLALRFGPALPPDRSSHSPPLAPRRTVQS